MLHKHSASGRLVCVCVWGGGGGGRGADRMCVCTPYLIVFKSMPVCFLVSLCLCTHQYNNKIYVLPYGFIRNVTLMKPFGETSNSLLYWHTTKDFHTPVCLWKYHIDSNFSLSFSCGFTTWRFEVLSISGSQARSLRSQLQSQLRKLLWKASRPRASFVLLIYRNFWSFVYCKRIGLRVVSKPLFDEEACL